MMIKDPKNPLCMIKDPFSGDGFVLPATKCTHERRLFFKRVKEIHALLLITKYSYDETNKIFRRQVHRFPKGKNTFLKLELNFGHSLMFPVGYLIEFTHGGINILTRQAFVMLYGSFETYLYQLFERSFILQGVAEHEITDLSIRILMGGTWNSKFNKMSNTLDLDFKARDLNQHFAGFELNFEDRSYENPLLFMDELSKVRHRIVHASSILEKDQLITVGIDVFHAFHGFYFLLTDFVDSLFEKKFGYSRPAINPADA